MSTVESLIETCRQAGVTLTARGGHLDVTAPKGTLTPALIAELKARKPEILSVLGSDRQPAALVDWNQTPDPFVAVTPFNQRAMDAIKAGNAVRVWSDVLEERLWWVRDEGAERKLQGEGCKLPIYTLAELEVVVGMGVEALKDIHGFKKHFGATVGKLTG